MKPEPCPTCGELADSPDAGPCDGDHPCARRLLDEALLEEEREHWRGLAREVRLAESGGVVG